MDRPLCSRLVRIKPRHQLILFALLVAFAGDNAAAEEAPKQAAKDSKAKSDKKGDVAEDAVATSGLYLGRLVKVDPKGRFIFVRPLEGSGERRTFYLDNLTLYREQRKKVQLSDFEPGRRIGVRYISEGDIAYAEGLFLIVGEVNPRDLQMPKKKFKPKPEGEKKEGEKGGHEAAKPEGGAKKGGH